MKKLIITAFVAASCITAYAQTPSGETPQQENKNQAEITFDKEVHDFGVIPQGTPASYTFVFNRFMWLHST